MELSWQVIERQPDTKNPKTSQILANTLIGNINCLYMNNLR